MFKRIEFEGDMDQPHCPKCGENLEQFMEDGCHLCPHVAFIYSDLMGDLVFCHERLTDEMDEILAGGPIPEREMEKWDQWLAQNELSSSEATELSLIHQHPVEKILRRVQSGNLFCISVTSCGMGCGPISETLHVGYDLSV